MREILDFFRKRIYEHIIKPIVFSVSPVNEAALGMAIGVFIGLTPTVGIQMWIVFLIWLFSRYILKLRFDLIIGTAVVWISNPFTMFFMYYGFLITGLSVFSFLGFEGIELNYSAFSHQLSQITNNPENSLWEVAVSGFKFLLIDLGLPMLIGSFFYAVPFAIASYFITRILLLQYRTAKAQKMGMDYDTWKQKYERQHIVLPKYSKNVKTKNAKNPIDIHEL